MLQVSFPRLLSSNSFITTTTVLFYHKAFRCFLNLSGISCISTIFKLVKTLIPSSVCTNSRTRSFSFSTKTSSSHDCIAVYCRPTAYSKHVFHPSHWLNIFISNLTPTPCTYEYAAYHHQLRKRHDLSGVALPFNEFLRFGHSCTANWPRVVNAAAAADVISLSAQASVSLSPLSLHTHLWHGRFDVPHQVALSFSSDRNRMKSPPIKVNLKAKCRH